MTWKTLRGEALTVVLMIAVFTVIPLVSGAPLPTWRTCVLLTLAVIAIRTSVHVVPAVWRRWRGPRAARPELPTERYGR